MPSSVAAIEFALLFSCSFRRAASCSLAASWSPLGVAGDSITCVEQNQVAVHFSISQHRHIQCTARHPSFHFVFDIILPIYNIHCCETLFECNLTLQENLLSPRLLMCPRSVHKSILKTSGCTTCVLIRLRLRVLKHHSHCNMY